jgi:hypothetical protein
MYEFEVRRSTPFVRFVIVIVCPSTNDEPPLVILMFAIEPETLSDVNVALLPYRGRPSRLSAAFACACVALILVGSVVKFLPTLLIVIVSMAPAVIVWNARALNSVEETFARASLLETALVFDPPVTNLMPLLRVTFLRELIVSVNET